MAAVTAGLVTAGVAAYGAYSANERAKDAAEDATPRDFDAEAEATFETKARLLPRRLELERQFQPEQDQIQLDRFEQVAGRMESIGRSADPNFQNLRTNILTSADEALDSDGALDERTRADIVARSRGAASARGLVFNKSSALAELMDTESERRKRMNEDRQFALAAGGFGGATQFDPYGVPLGRSVGDQLDPESAYAADAYNTNLNAAESRRIAARNNQAALYGAGIEALGRTAEAFG